MGSKVITIVVLLVATFAFANILSQYYPVSQYFGNPIVGCAGGDCECHTCQCLGTCTSSTSSGTPTGKFRIVGWWGSGIGNHAKSTNSVLPGYDGPGGTGFWKAAGGYNSGSIGLGAHSIGYKECGDEWASLAEADIQAGYNAIDIEAERPMCAADTQNLKTFMQKYPGVPVFAWMLINQGHDPNFFNQVTYIIAEDYGDGTSYTGSIISWANQDRYASKTLIGLGPSLKGLSTSGLLSTMDYIRTNMPSSPGIVFFHWGIATPEMTNAIDNYISTSSCGGNNLYPDVNGNCRPAPVCVCSLGSSQACGNCGTQTCTNSCQWGSCQNQGVCNPTSTQSCNYCSGNQYCTGGTQPCQSNCQWNSCSGGSCSLVQGQCGYTTTTTTTTTPPSTSITLNQGWNMISLPVNPTSQIQSNCQMISPIWHYNPSTQAYNQISGLSQATTGSGYWMKVSGPCTITSKGSNITISNFPQLNSGWNQIGSPTQSTTFSPGNCQVTSGPWKYNPQTNQYENSQMLDPGFGYWVKVQNSCQLS